MIRTALRPRRRSFKLSLPSTGVQGSIRSSYRAMQGRRPGTCLRVSRLDCLTEALAWDMERARMRLTNTYFLIQSTNSKVSGMHGAILAHVNYLYELAAK